MKIQIGEKDYEIDNLTIEQYEIVMDNPNIKDDELIALLTGAPLEDIKQAPYSQIKFVSNFLKTSGLLYDDIGAPLEMVIMINGKKYGLIEPSKLSYEEWINLEVFMAQDPINAGLLATHLYRPLVKDNNDGFRQLIPYTLEECQSRVDEFRKHMSIKKFSSALFFLTTFAQELTSSFLSSMETKVKKEIKQMKEKKIIQTIKK